MIVKQILYVGVKSYFGTYFGKSVTYFNARRNIKKFLGFCKYVILT